jgi:cytochrome bd-type quinol oxidase subunit 1
MKVLLSRWQFGVTITYHFLFVPLTIGLALLVAIMQVLAYRRKDAVWERLTRFFGTLFLINFAMGIVTGIVQEFQFGMNWSNYWLPNWLPKPISKNPSEQSGRRDFNPRPLDPQSRPACLA